MYFRSLIVIYFQIIKKLKQVNFDETLGSSGWIDAENWDAQDITHNDLKKKRPNLPKKKKVSR